MTTADEMSDLDSQHSRQSSTYKMSIDSDDSSSYKSSLRDMAVSNWANTVERNNIREEEPRRTSSRRDPERRTVNRRSSLLPKSKALLRVIDQADEDTHLADLEMRREHGTTAQLGRIEDGTKPQQEIPAPSWTKLLDTTMPLYTCSKLNPEIEMTNFQLENISNGYKSIKRKASEDRFEPYPTSMSLKRRAVSPSVSLNGSPVLSNMSSPPTNFFPYGNTSNAAAKPKSGTFNLQDASGGLSRMSISK
ncbi:hypothetical protein INT47_011695 [Mucor saturninus]|uniref:Uncharacterized protein n=1 Tax=Mucor saturninus TaxID=64648 RepID=A0A8H7UYP6_9FUNG|nr:hypothetical protein INT47_011695 [Mucor saturninus]